LHQVTSSKKLNNKLKVVISLLSKTKSESESFMIRFYGNPLNSARGCIQTVVTAAVVTEIMRMSKRRKGELVVNRICKQPLPCLAYLLSLRPDCLPVCPVCPESFQHPALTSKSHSYQTVHYNRHMSNQREDEFVNGNFRIQSF
jgi:hypothetical protein